MTIKTLIATTALSAALAAPAATAQEREPENEFEAMMRTAATVFLGQEAQNSRYDDDRYDDDRYERGYRDGQRDAWRAGQRLPRDVNYRVIRDYERHGYGPPPRGHAYYEVDGEVLLIQTATQLIVEALSR